jgi:hypothetical protein
LGAPNIVRATLQPVFELSRFPHWCTINLEKQPHSVFRVHREGRGVVEDLSTEGEGRIFPGFRLNGAERPLLRVLGSNGHVELQKPNCRATEVSFEFYR